LLFQPTSKSFNRTANKKSDQRLKRNEGSKKRLPKKIRMRKTGRGRSKKNLDIWRKKRREN
jgi:hypothetical protein